MYGPRFEYMILFVPFKKLNSTPPCAGTSRYLLWEKFVSRIIEIGLIWCIVNSRNYKFEVIWKYLFFSLTPSLLSEIDQINQIVGEKLNRRRFTKSQIGWYVVIQPRKLILFNRKSGILQWRIRQFQLPKEF